MGGSKVLRYKVFPPVLHPVWGYDGNHRLPERETVKRCCHAAFRTTVTRARKPNRTIAMRVRHRYCAEEILVTDVFPAVVKEGKAKVL